MIVDMRAAVGETTLSRRKIRNLVADPSACAEAVNLVYVSDREAGITREKKGKGFTYRLNGSKLSDAALLMRIKKLVIPPAWRQVWICPAANGHLQATGVDTRNRKQYLYHPLWTALRGQTKFFNLYEFGCCLPAVRRQLRKDISLPGLPLRKVLAAVVSVMDQTGIRIGCDAYEKMYGSFGLTTLKDQHVKFDGTKAIFSFRGKKGVSQNITLKNKKLAQIVRQCRDIPGRELFQYLDENGQRHRIDSGLVNEYIREISGRRFTSKDFRTWVGTLCAIEQFRSAGLSCTEGELKKKIIETIDAVADKLGNTRSVCRKYYIHPVVVDHYTNGTIERFFEDIAEADELSACEQALLRMLDESSRSTTALMASA